MNFQDFDILFICLKFGIFCREASYVHKRLLSSKAHSISTTGNFHGMPVYYISDLSDVHKNSSKVSVENIAYIGVRDVDVEEIKILKENNMRNYTKDEIIRRGIRT